MQLTLLKSKIHRGTVTQADLEYEGSCAIDADLLQASGLRQYERIEIYNLTNGERFATYAIQGQPGSGTICINGAAARLVSRGDLVIIASWQEMEHQAARAHKPKLVFVDENNRRKDPQRDHEEPGQGDLKKAI